MTCDAPLNTPRANSFVQGCVDVVVDFLTCEVVRGMQFQIYHVKDSYSV